MGLGSSATIPTRSGSGQRPTASQAPKKSARRSQKTSGSSLSSRALQPSAPAATRGLRPRAMPRSTAPSKARRSGPLGERGAQHSTPNGDQSSLHFLASTSTTAPGSRVHRPSTVVATGGRRTSPLTQRYRSPGRHLRAPSTQSRQAARRLAASAACASRNPCSASSAQSTWSAPGIRSHRSTQAPPRYGRHTPTRARSRATPLWALSSPAGAAARARSHRHQQRARAPTSPVPTGPRRPSAGRSLTRLVCPRPR